MIVLLIVLRIFHVLGGVFWVGAALAMNLFINPSLRATAESGQKVTAHLITQTKFALALIVSSAATVTLRCAGPKPRRVARTEYVPTGTLRIT